MAAASTASRMLNVLVIEDEPRLRELLVDVIGDLGFHAVAARSAEEARRLIEQAAPHILMLDLQLPGIGGMEFFEEIRQKHGNMQVIVLTGFGTLQAAQQAIRLDVVEFLGKPFLMSDIERALDRAARRVHLPLPSVDQGAPPSPGGSTLAESEREQILTALQRNAGNRTKTARELGISRRTLHYRLDEYKKQGFDVG
jgi:DNA-binding NtrC family response regulator